MSNVDIGVLIPTLWPDLESAIPGSNLRRAFPQAELVLVRALSSVEVPGKASRPSSTKQQQPRSSALCDEG